jgi:predicted GIY-YIG superfamily endonuclease
LAKEKKEKEYIYIVQAAKEKTRCKIGKTNDLERRLKEYNSITGKSTDNEYEYLFTCEVKNAALLEHAVKVEFARLREEENREIYFFNKALFQQYVVYIKRTKWFVKEISLKVHGKKEIVKIVKKITPSLERRGVTKKDILQKAQRVKDDEFYTRLEDVESELEMYDKRIWVNKTVLCNCDDAVDNDVRDTSAFAIYFLQNFHALEIKKLICTHYSGDVDLFNQGSKAYIFTKDGFREQKEFPKNYDGSFEHPLSLKLLEESDIVCTNPPFSRAPDYWKLVVGSGKRFLIISNITNVITKSFIPFFYEKKVWAGFNRVDNFLTPKRQITEAAAHWFTNFPIKNRPKYKRLKIVPLKEIPEKYKTYDDSKVLLVDNCFIPSDYKKRFAVSTRPILNGILEKGFELVEDKEYYPYINGKKRFARVLVQKI